MGGRYVFDADTAEGFYHTACDQIVDSLLLGRQARRCYLLEHVLRNVAAPRAGIGDVLLFVERLRDAERLVGREAVARVGILLKRREVVQQGRLLLYLLVLDCDDAHLVGVHDGGIGCLCRLLVVEPLCRKSGEKRGVFGCGEFELEIGRRLEGLVFQVTGADDGQRGRLNTSQRPHAAPCGDGESLRGVDADDPIGLAAGFGREVEVVVLLARP